MFSPFIDRIITFFARFGVWIFYAFIIIGSLVFLSLLTALIIYIISKVTGGITSTISESHEMKRNRKLRSMEPVPGRHGIEYAARSGRTRFSLKERKETERAREHLCSILSGKNDE